MPAAPCSLLLEVYLPGGEELAWSVSSDPDHVRPYLIGPERYEGQEIDPVSAAATIGTVEVGVIDPAQIPGEQTTGWMTERLAGLRGRRCRLRRRVDDVIGWVLIADGPAGVPRLDASYSAYRWPIRDTREIERKLKAFNSGGTAAIAPQGSVENWGATPEDSPEPFLLEGAVEHPLLGAYAVNEGSMFGFRIGYVDLEAPAPISEEGENAIQSQGDGTQSIHPYADILWRLAGSDDPWNVARPVWPAPFSAGQLPLAQVEGDEEEGRQITRVYLWALPTGADPDGSEPFDADPVTGVGEQLEVIIRHRGLASDIFPYYYDGEAGALLEDLYNGRLSGLDAKAVDAAARLELYDPAGQEDINALLAGGIKYDVEAVQQITTPVLLRQVSPAEDGRNWAELNIYGPTGWIPALDGDGNVSPVSRARPGVVTGPTINDAIAEPSPDWNAGERIVTAVSMTYKRYFKPGFDLTTAVEADGLAVREVGLTYIDPTAQANEGEQPESFDGSAFGAVGDAAGNAPVGNIETGQLLFQDLRFEVLGRYAQGAQAVRVRVRREDVPFLRVGDWCPAALSWLPNTFTGLRGLALSAVQVLSIDDSECAWRSLLLEESPVAAPPGYFYDLEVLSDEAEAGYFFDLEILSDEEEV